MCILHSGIITYLGLLKCRDLTCLRCLHFANRLTNRLTNRGEFR